MDSMKSDGPCRRSRQLATLFVIFIALSASTVFLLEHQDASDADATAVPVDFTGNREYTITFNANGGTPEHQQRTTVNGKVSDLPTVERDGYTFDGWFTKQSGGSKVTTSYPFDGDTVVYAHWSEKPSSSGGTILYVLVGVMAAVMIVGVGIAFLTLRRSKMNSRNNN